ncbi:hypothetical protein [Rhodococcus pyridinivorans]
MGIFVEHSWGFSLSLVKSEGTVAGSLSISRRDAEDRLQRLVEPGVIGRKPSGHGTYNRHYTID